MSTGVDARRRPGIWSYISFTSSTRKRSVSLPKPNNNHGKNSYDKGNNYRSSGWNSASLDTLENIKESHMTGGQRARWLKTGGVLVFVLFLLYLFSPSNTVHGVREVVKGMPAFQCICEDAHAEAQVTLQLAFRLERQIQRSGRPNAQNPAHQVSP